ncbi:MAG: glycerol-3-phosphate 1-O-acyltransferase PlsY [Rhodobacteraceae bacterium]|nr:glycerol-3-phosphate 1-O-acyltransferase PlsY [Paracoccaceae bacterium]
MIPIIETPMSSLVLVATLAYLLGAVPFGLLVARLMGLGDLRQIGSGNIGATNVLRTGNKLAAGVTLLLDAGKGAVAVFLAGLWFAPDAAQLAGLAAFIGHLFPIWLGFRGGKGVATFLGVLLALSFFAGLQTCITWFAIAMIFRLSSAAALAASVAAVIWLWMLRQPDVIGVTLVMAALIWWRHRANIARLRDGTEPRIGGNG